MAGTKAAKAKAEPRPTEAPPRRRSHAGAVMIAAVVLALAAAAVGALAVNSRGRARRLAYVERIQTAMGHREYEIARTTLDAWSAESPRDPEAFYQRARVEVAADQPQRALDAMEEAVKRGADPGPLSVLRAVLLARAGRFEEAEPILLAAYDDAKVLDPEVAEGLTRVYLTTFRLFPASKLLDRWISEAPDDARPYLYKIEVDTRGDVDPAVVIAHYRMALQRNPDLAKARLGLADKLRDNQRTDEALTEYETYLKGNPRSVDAHVGAGQVALRKGDLQKAINHFSAALDANPMEPIALRELALTDLRAGRFALARDRLTKVVQVDPFDPEVRMSYARALKMSGDEAGSKEQTAVVERLRKEHLKMADIRKALVLSPKSLDLRCDAAEWLLDHGHETEGLEWTALILRERPDHPKTCAVLTDYYRKKGNLGLANFYKMTARNQGAAK